jgi:(1->4)-alpha-D-glucan 1-alpha-D-glucosylmutase
MRGEARMSPAHDVVSPSPRATVRLQLNAEFTLFDAVATVPYYASLGISHLYLSPIQQARRGSTHGYDGTDPTRLDAARGGRDGLRALVAAARAHAMGVIVDIVPNHLSSSLENPWWFDVLERGVASRYAGFFAIDRDDPDPALRSRVLAPFLAEPLDAMIARDAIALRYDEATTRIVVDVDGAAYPFAADAYAALVAEALPQIEMPSDDGVEFEVLLRALTDAMRDGKHRAPFDAFLDRANRDGDALRRWLGAQHYALCDWRDVAHRLNWRRFFDIAELVALRSDDDAVFEAFHALIFELYAAGEIDGVRVDHIDGLAEPAAYCRKLRARLAELEPKRPSSAPRGPAYIVVEKILAEGEAMRAWPIDGTTGYDFMDVASALLHDARGQAALDATWCRIGGSPYPVIEEACREEVLRASFAPEFARAARAAQRALPRFDAVAIERALAALTIGYRRYRGYARATVVDENDRIVLEAAADFAAREGTDVDIARALVRLHVGDTRDIDDGSATPALRAFQHLTAPLAARAGEDTAFYRYGRLISRNEVGASPSRLAIDASHFHEAMTARARAWPNAMLATATHDHKLGEDARMRIASLSGCADEWCALVAAWLDAHTRYRSRDVPDAVDAAMLYQTLVGCWPDARSTDVAPEFRERVHAWQVKAIRERKQHGGWAAPDVAYERGAAAFLDALFDDAAFVTELTTFLARIDAAAAVRSLVQTTLRLTCPGVPDLYQGTEFWDFSLVDPDNRRAVDYDARRAALDARVDDATLFASWRDGRVKQRLIERLLRLRAREPDLFAGDYVPLRLSGADADGFLAFARGCGERRLVVVVPVRSRDIATERLTLLPEGTSDTSMGGFRESDAIDVLSGRRVGVAKSMAIAALLDPWPITVIRVPASALPH